MRDKKRLTETLVGQLDGNNQLSVKQAMHTWWFNIRNQGGLRLTGIGYTVFCDCLDLEYYKFEITDPKEFTQRVMLMLDKKLQMPYYIEITKGIPKRVIFFGSKEAVMVNLYGNLTKFLKSY